MGTYILMTKMIPEISADLKRREGIGKQWKKKVAESWPAIEWKRFVKITREIGI
jgi:hypothetical protein